MPFQTCFLSVEFVTGHLAGILVGLMYIKGPLKMVMDSVLAPGMYRYSAPGCNSSRTDE